MTEERTTPLRERMIEDMRIHGMGDKAQKAHIRAVKDFALFLRRSPDTATPDVSLRAAKLFVLLIQEAGVAVAMRCQTYDSRLALKNPT